MSERKNYTVLLDVDSTEFVKKDLKLKGMTLSGFLRASIDEYRKSLEILNPKGLEEMTVAEFLKTIQEFASKMTEPETEEEVKRIEEKLKD